MTHRTMPERDPQWAAFLKASLERAERFRAFMGDDRAANAMLAEGAAVFDPHDHAQLLRGRVDVTGMPARELIRWDV